jgi:hypothetical protein
MSTLCRAKQRWQEYGGAETSVRPFFCQIHFSAFQKGRVKGSRKISDDPKNFGSISGKRPFSEIISDLFFGKGRGLGQSKRACHAAAPKAVPPKTFGVRGEGGSNLSRVRRSLTLPENLCKCFTMNDLHPKTSQNQSRSVKLGQTD